MYFNTKDEKVTWHRNVTLKSAQNAYSAMRAKLRNNAEYDDVLFIHVFVGYGIQQKGSNTMLMN